MRKLVTGVGLAAILVGSTIGASAAPRESAHRASANRVVCVSFGGNGESHYSLRSQPRKCTFVHRNQQPFGYNTVDMIRLRWKSWGTRRARAKGKQVVNMVGPTPARMTLKRPRRGCGNRTVFTQAVFSAPGSNDKSRLPLDACTHGR